MLEYHRPASLDEAVALLGRLAGDVNVMAGGVEVLMLISNGTLKPGNVVDLGGVPGLAGVSRHGDGGLEIGSMTSHRAAERSALLRTECPALAYACSTVGNIRIRNQGTIGGNVVRANPIHDLAPVLLALDAEVALTSMDGERVIRLDEFYVASFTTVIRPDEVLVTVRVPPVVGASTASYHKHQPGSKGDSGTLGIAIRLDRDDDGSCVGVAIGLGGLGPVPFRARRAEVALGGTSLSDDEIRAASALVAAESDPISDTRGSSEYKRRVASVLATRALVELRDRTIAARPT